MLRAVNAVAATSFVVGGSLFATGAALAQTGAARGLYLTVYLVGGVFFSTGGYFSVVQAVNEPVEPGGTVPPRWHWWSYEPLRLAWASAAVLFAGTLVFAVNLVDSFIAGLGAGAEDRLVWAPNMVGCALFLISGHLAMLGIGGRRFWALRDLGWWIVAVNQLGSLLFMVSAVASFVRPSSGEELAAAVANWGTLTGALCFAAAGVMQEFEHPAGPRRRRPAPST